MGPVFLFNMGIVIFVVSTAAGEGDWGGSITEVAQEVMVKELGSVVAVKAKKGERERLFDMADLQQDIGFAAAPDGALFAPAGGNVNTVNGMGELAGHGLTAVGDSVGLKEARLCLVPLFSGNGDLVTKQGSWFGSATTAVLVTHTNWFKQSIDGSSRDAQQRLQDVGR